MKKMGYYLWMSMMGSKNSSRHFITIFSIGLFIFFSTQMVSAWIVKLTEEEVQADIETNRTIRWQFEETLQEHLITEEQIMVSIVELQNHPDIEQVLYDADQLNTAVIIIRDYRDLLEMGNYIQSHYFGGTAVSGKYTASQNLIKGIQISTNIINRLTQIISFLTYAVLVSKYLEKRKKEMYRLWIVGCTDRRNIMLLFAGTLIFLTIAIFINVILSVLTVSCVIFLFIAHTQTLIASLLISLNMFLSLTPFIVVFVLINVLVSLYKGNQLISRFSSR
ncbi:hypothetical protein QE109_12855 [Fusibacter bizertensis]|uniref:Uncharacterized protein n=1 Tax=Fusibacter bizertensis TaxID=1488331 RepID=A0ABT6NF37_9FIRM|nr:hypothetical protein [Fusibacter bizertensis]MDH8679042.1 hypothetical protein [Fusibacter bizertensis]